jgi:hypothetical protein
MQLNAHTNATMAKEVTTERAEIIAYLKAKDDFFAKVDFKAYTLEELRNFKRRWDDLPMSKSKK